MKTSAGRVYMALLIAGVIIPWAPLLMFVMEKGLDIPLFAASMFSNKIAAAVAADLFISAFVFFAWAFHETRQLGMPGKYWLYAIPLTFLVGMSCGLPYFLLMRERYLPDVRER